MRPVFRGCLYSNYTKWFTCTSGFQIRQGMQQNIIPVPTSILPFKVQFFAETYFRVFKSFAKIAKIRSSRKFPLIRYELWTPMLKKHFLFWGRKKSGLGFCWDLGSKQVALTSLFYLDNRWHSYFTNIPVPYFYSKIYFLFSDAKPVVKALKFPRLFALLPQLFPLQFVKILEEDDEVFAALEKDIDERPWVFGFKRVRDKGLLPANILFTGDFLWGLEYTVPLIWVFCLLFLTVIL